MRIRYLPADPAGNLTGFVLSPVFPGERAALAARLMAACPEGFDQIGYVDEASLDAPLPRLDMMGGEFCGNAARAFGLMVARRRGLTRGSLCVSVSGAADPVPVEFDVSKGEAFAQMALPRAVLRIRALGEAIDVVRMEGIAHAVVTRAPSQEAADAVLAAMPDAPAQGVLFREGTRMTPLVRVGASGTCVWEGSCGSGTAALAFLRARGLEDGEHDFAFDEPAGRLHARVRVEAGQPVRITMGGGVTFGEEKEIEIQAPLCSLRTGTSPGSF